MISSPISVAALQGKLRRRLFKPWQAIAKAMGEADAFRSPQERNCLKAAVNFSANICAVHNIESQHVLLKLDNTQRSDGCVVKGVGNPVIEIHLHSRLFLRSKVQDCLFVVAHEFGHIVNGDIDDEKILTYITQAEYEKLHLPNLTICEQRDRAHENHRSELAADTFAAKTFPSLVDGVSAGVASLEQKIADELKLAANVSALIRQPVKITPADYRFSSHPSPQLRIRMLKRLMTAPK